MAQINDAKKATLANLGYTGPIDEAYHNYLAAETGSDLDATQDLEKLLFTTLGYTGSLYDMWFEFLRDNGFTNSLQDMLYAFWNSDDAGLSPLHFSEFYSPLEYTAVPTRAAAGTTATFTRATTSTWPNNDGYMVTGVAGEIGFVGARRVRNLLTFTEDFSNAVWDKYQCTAPVNVVVGPTGRVTNTLTADANGGQHAVRQNVTVISGNTIIWSVYVKAGTASWVRLQCVSLANANCFFNISSGAVGTAVGCTGTIEDAGGGWYRCSIKGTTSATSGFNQVELADGDNDVNSVVSSGLTAYIGGAQLEDVTAQTTQTAGEYVSVGVPSDWAGDELVTNGDFSNGTTGWTTDGSTFVASGGSATLTNTGAANGYAYQIIATVAGTKYVAAFNLTLGTAATPRLFAGTSLHGGELGVKTVSASGRYTLEFTATGASTYLELATNSATAGHTATYDNISVKPAYYHGSMVDGVKCFPTDLSGNPIPSTTMLGYQAQGARTNYQPNSNAFTTGWTKTAGVSFAQNAADDDGATTAWTATVTGASQYITYGTTGVAANQICTLALNLWPITAGTTRLSVYNTTGGANFYADCNPTDGTITTSVAGGTVIASGSIPIAGGGYRFWIAGTTNGTSGQVNNPVVYYGNGVSVKHSKVQFEIGSFATSYIATTTIAVARNADVLTYSSAGNIDGTKGWAYAELRMPTSTGGNAYVMDVGSNRPTMFIDSLGVDSLYDGTATRLFSTYTFGDQSKICNTWGGASSVGAVDGAVTTYGFDGDLNTGAAISIGCSNASASHVFGTIRNVRIGQRQLSASEMQAITA